MSAKSVRVSRLVLAAAIATSALTGSLAASTAAHAVGSSAVNGQISRTEVLARAQSWVDEGVPYSQDGGHPWVDSNGSYRSDCSGYVSMSWHLGRSETTWTLPGVSTRLGSFDELKPGDALDRYNPSTGEFDTHVILFAGWVDGAHTSANIYTESTWGTNAAKKTYSRGYLNSANYVGFRYNRIVDSSGSQSYPNPSGLPSGTLVKSANSPTVKVMIGGAGLSVAGSDVAPDGYDLSKVVTVDEAGFNALPTAPADGTVVHDMAGGADRFLIVGGAALPIAGSEWNANGYNTRPDMGVPTAWLQNARQNSLPAGTVVHDEAGGADRFVVVGGVALPISGAEWNADGYNVRPDLAVPGGWLASAKQGTLPAGLLVKGQGGTDSSVYVMINGSALPITGAEWTADGYNTQTLMGVPETWLQGTVAKPLKNGTVVKEVTGADPTVAVMVGGAAIPLSYADFTGLGYDKQSLMGVPGTWLHGAMAKPAPSDGTMLVSPDSNTVWMVTNGGSKKAMTADQFGPGKYSFSDVVTVPTALTAKLPTVTQ
ncbi:hypothetical protein [Kitasatospora sp. NPDC094015]|uniref:hypothetical protein n=1 Tax=Kitasatospora sp. NPDC094015 TaxID=3155205 RepID=UPI00332C1C00